MKDERIADFVATYRRKPYPKPWYGDYIVPKGRKRGETVNFYENRLRKLWMK